MPDAALPAKLILEEPYASAATDRANNAVGPFGTAGHEVVEAVLGVREVNDCFLKGLGLVFHASIVSQNLVLVKYIFTLNWDESRNFSQVLSHPERSESREDATLYTDLREYRRTRG
jgi:hypothetical protein